MVAPMMEEAWYSIDTYTLSLQKDIIHSVSMFVIEEIFATSFVQCAVKWSLLSLLSLSSPFLLPPPCLLSLFPHFFPASSSPLSLPLLLYIPNSPFIMDAFKRVYSNEDIETKAIPYLWENFDKEGWSLWRADYRYNNELKMSFMAANLIGGMFQRVEKLHKYGFGSVLVFGEDYKLSISGIWLFRGQQLAFNVSCVVQCCEAGVMWP